MVSRCQLMSIDHCLWFCLNMPMPNHDRNQLTRKLVIDTVRDGIFSKVHGRGPDEISGILAHWVSSQFTYLPISFRQDVAQLWASWKWRLVCNEMRAVEILAEIKAASRALQHVRRLKGNWMVVKPGSYLLSGGCKSLWLTHWKQLLVLQQ